ncbi:MAG: MucB/RseB C-terminal domain-containing protein [Halopseudomonas sp.]
MNDSIKQSMSALMDDEAGELELRRALKELDSETSSAWTRYHIARSALKGDAPSQPQIDISDRVMAELDQEPVYDQSVKSASRFQWRPLGSVAIAASVTMMVIFGAQNYQGDADVVMPSPVVLSAPSPINPNVMPVQYGERAVVAPSLQQADVIRLSSSMEYYIDQHHALTDNRPAQWLVGWVPEGFEQVEHDHFSDAEVLLYSNGQAAISVSVQPFAAKKASPGAMQSGDTVAVGKRVDDQFVTVVGDVPFMIADRIASSIALKNN